MSPAMLSVVAPQEAGHLQVEFAHHLVLSPGYYRLAAIWLRWSCPWAVIWSCRDCDDVACAAVRDSCSICNIFKLGVMGRSASRRISSLQRAGGRLERLLTRRRVMEGLAADEVRAAISALAVA